MDTAIGDLGTDLDGEEQPGLDICQRLDALIPFKCVALDACHVLFDTLNSLDAVGFAEKSRLRWGIGKEEKDSEGPSGSDTSKNEKDGLET